MNYCTYSSITLDYYLAITELIMVNKGLQQSKNHSFTQP